MFLLQKSKLFEEVKSYQKVTFLESPFGHINCAREEEPLKSCLIRRENSLEVLLTGSRDSLVKSLFLREPLTSYQNFIVCSVYRTTVQETALPGKVYLVQIHCPDII